jgi:hypothetical protein
MSSRAHYQNIEVGATISGALGGSRDHPEPQFY